MSRFSNATLAVLVLVLAGNHVCAQVQHAHDVSPPATASSLRQTEAGSPAETSLKIAKTDTVIHVGDLHCKTCAKKIARRLYTVKGVMKVRSDIEADVVIVTPQSKKLLDAAALWAASQKAGFPPVKLVGPTGTFEVDPETKGPRQVTEEVARRVQ